MAGAVREKYWFGLGAHGAVRWRHDQTADTSNHKSAEQIGASMDHHHRKHDRGAGGLRGGLRGSALVRRPEGGTRVRIRYTILAATSLLAVTAVLTQAAAAYAAEGYITLPFAPTRPAAVLNAAGCGIPANIIQWPYSPNSSCAGGGWNELWYFNAISGYSGETSFKAYYRGYAMCMNVKGNDYASGTPIIAYPCNNGVTDNEKFNVITNPDIGGFDIFPAYQPHPNLFCFNIAGGFGTGHHVILYRCAANYANSAFATSLL
jgi:hypothetical protein